MGRLRQRRALRRLLVPAGVAAAALAGPGAPGAQAHNVLLSTTPAAHSTVPALPNLIVLRYDLPAQALGTIVIVRGPSGNVADGPAELIDSDVDQPIRRGSPPGPYTVDWRVVSADGHVVQGTFGFTAQAASTGTAAPLPSAVHAAPAPAALSGDSTALIVVATVIGLVVVLVLVLLVARGRPRPDGDEDDEGDGDDSDDDDPGGLADKG